MSDQQILNQDSNKNADAARRPIVLETEEGWRNPATLELFLAAMIPSASYRKKISDFLTQSGFKFSSVSELVARLRAFYRDAVNWQAKYVDKEAIEMSARLIDFETNYRNSLDVFSPQNKPNPDAVFWPDQTRNPEKSIFKCIPTVRNLAWVNPETPIGSAGSCFASEIAYNLQKRKFNYVVTENFMRPEEGVISDDFDKELGLCGASANWGILFNTGSFRQLAEVAFGEKELPKILIKANHAGQDFFTFPFRENVYFRTPEDFERDRPKHLQAVRDVFQKCKVFVITPGLNECWQLYNDTTYLSRNPRHTGLAGLVRHRVLTLQENIDNLQRFIDIVRAHNHDIKFIISVSPVPLLATGRSRDMHIVQANGHSKAMLRVAVEEICNRNRDVAYFPSFEVISSCTQNPFQADARHVTREGVERVMTTFEQMFVSQN